MTPGLVSTLFLAFRGVQSPGSPGNIGYQHHHISICSSKRNPLSPFIHEHIFSINLCLFLLNLLCLPEVSLPAQELALPPRQEHCQEGRQAAGL